jgi:Trk K+ transport system NAD-binding subunit
MKRVLVLGAGQLASRVRQLVTARGHELVTLPDGPVEQVLATANLGVLSMIYLLDERDETNLQLLIAVISVHKTVPVTAALFNENIAPHLRAAHPHTTIVNPARLAAPVFLAGLHAPLERVLRYTPTEPPAEPRWSRTDSLLGLLLASFAGVVLAATTFFHFHDHMPVLDALYFVVSTSATVGYGDINLLNAPALSKLVDIALILVSTVFIWVIFSLTVDRIIKKRVELSLGRKRYSMRDHVVLCGLGRLGYFVADGLLAEGENVIIIEKNESAPRTNEFRRRGAHVYVGDARLPRVLQDVAAGRAKAVFSLTDDDHANIEIGLNARAFNPNLRLILRISDQTTAERLKDQLDIYLAFSPAAVVDEQIVDLLK